MKIHINTLFKILNPHFKNMDHWKYYSRNIHLIGVQNFLNIKIYIQIQVIFNAYEKQLEDLLPTAQECVDWRCKQIQYFLDQYGSDSTYSIGFIEHSSDEIWHKRKFKNFKWTKGESNSTNLLLWYQCYHHLVKVDNGKSSSTNIFSWPNFFFFNVNISIIIQDQKFGCSFLCDENTSSLTV